MHAEAATAVSAAAATTTAAATTATATAAAALKGVWIEAINKNSQLKLFVSVCLRFIVC